MRSSVPIDMFTVLDGTCDTDRPYEFQRPGGQHLAALRGAAPSACDHLFLFGTNRQFQAHLEATLEGVQIATRASGAAWAHGAMVLRALLREFLGRDRVPAIVRAHVTAARMDLTQSLVDQRVTTPLPMGSSETVAWDTEVAIGPSTSPLRLAAARIWAKEAHGGKRPVVHRGLFEITKGASWVSDFTRAVLYLCPHDDDPEPRETLDLPGLTGVRTVRVAGQWDAPPSWRASGEDEANILGVEHIAPSLQAWRMWTMPVAGREVVCADKLIVVLHPSTMEPLWIEVQGDEFRWGRKFSETELGAYVASLLAEGGPA